MSQRLFLSLLFLLPLIVNGQSKIKLDSLELRLKNATTDTTRIKTLLSIADYYAKSNYMRAIESAREARTIAINKNLKRHEAGADNTIANYFLAMGDYKNASVHFFNAFKFYESVKDSARMVNVCNNLGAVYDRLADFDKALEYYLRAQTLLNRLKLDKAVSPLSSLYNNIGNVYQAKGDTTAARQYYEKALMLAIESNKKDVQGIAYNNLGKLHFTDLKDYNKGLDYLQKGLAVRLEAGDKGAIAKSHNALANFYLVMGDFQKAKEATSNTIALSEETGSVDMQKYAYATLSQIEEELGHYPQSLEAFKIFKMLNDSIQNQLASSEITRLQLQYDFEKAEQAREAQEQEARFQYITTIVILSVGLIIAVLIVVIVRNKAKQTELKQKNLSQDVEIKNKELTTNVMYLIRKNELINSVAERLLNLQSNLKPENHKVVHDIILELQKEADNDSWKEFELRFHQVHSEFYKNLRQLYPNLSPADEKLCAFLRLNMSSKEIAAITQQSIKSVEVARARLRKKLNLTNTTSNLVTHLSNL